MAKPRIVILASGEGTTAEAVIVASAKEQVNFNVSLIISNNSNAGVFKRVNNLNKKYRLKINCELAGDDKEIQNLLKAHEPDLIVLMGYMKKIGPKLVYQYGWRPQYLHAHEAMMINTHPGLLPATKALYGINVQKYVLNNKLAHAGQTLHVVSENYDEGPIISEHKTKVLASDTPDTLFERVKILEKQHLPSDVEKFINKRRGILAIQ